MSGELLKLMNPFDYQGVARVLASVVNGTARDVDSEIACIDEYAPTLVPATLAEARCDRHGRRGAAAESLLALLKIAERHGLSSELRDAGLCVEGGAEEAAWAVFRGYSKPTGLALARCLGVKWRRTVDDVLENADDEATVLEALPSSGTSACWRLADPDSLDVREAAANEVLRLPRTDATARFVKSITEHLVRGWRRLMETSENVAVFRGARAVFHACRPRPLFDGDCGKQIVNLIGECWFEANKLEATDAFFDCWRGLVDCLAAQSWPVYARAFGTTLSSAYKAKCVERSAVAADGLLHLVEMACKAADEPNAFGRLWRPLSLQFEQATVLCPAGACRALAALADVLDASSLDDDAFGGDRGLGTIATVALAAIERNDTAAIKAWNALVCRLPTKCIELAGDAPSANVLDALASNAPVDAVVRAACARPAWLASDPPLGPRVGSRFENPDAASKLLMSLVDDARSDASGLMVSFLTSVWWAAASCHKSIITSDDVILAACPLIAALHTTYTWLTTTVDGRTSAHAAATAKLESHARQPVAAQYVGNLADVVARDLSRSEPPACGPIVALAIFPALRTAAANNAPFFPRLTRHVFELVAALLATAAALSDHADQEIHALVAVYLLPPATVHTALAAALALADSARLAFGGRRADETSRAATAAFCCKAVLKAVADAPDAPEKLTTDALDGAKPVLVTALVSTDRHAKALASQATARLDALCRDDPELNLDPQLVVAWRQGGKPATPVAARSATPTFMCSPPRGHVAADDATPRSGSRTPVSRPLVSNDGLLSAARALTAGLDDDEDEGGYPERDHHVKRARLAFSTKLGASSQPPDSLPDVWT